MESNPDGDLQTRYDMLRSWLSEADASNDRLKKHLENTLEIAYTWQPSYATKMDRDTLALASQAIGYEPHPTIGPTSANPAVEPATAVGLTNLLCRNFRNTDDAANN